MCVEQLPWTYLCVMSVKRSDFRETVGRINPHAPCPVADSNVSSVRTYRHAALACRLQWTMKAPRHCHARLLCLISAVLCSGTPDSVPVHYTNYIPHVVKDNTSIYQCTTGLDTVCTNRESATRQHPEHSRPLARCQAQPDGGGSCGAAHACIRLTTKDCLLPTRQLGDGTGTVRCCYR
jgi:hypothetical protein